MPLKMQAQWDNLIKTIEELEKKYHRAPHSVSLLAASKGQSLEKIKAAIDAGQRSFGENYVQEALEKIKAINNPNIEWHFIGHIQSNKTKAIAENFSWVHSLCDKKIAQRLNDQRPLHLPPLQVCLEVNLDQEKTKSGVVSAEELISLADYCKTLPRLKLRGLMAMPLQCATFHQVYLLKEKLHLDTLSMGMTKDMEAAIAEGSTWVRIGEGLFGPRNS